MPFSVHRTFLWPPELPLHFGTGQGERKELLTQRTEERTSKSSLPHHPSPPACSFLSIWHFQGLPAGPAFKDANSLLLQRLPGPAKSHRLTAAPSQHPRMCAFVGFCFCRYTGSPKGNKGWDRCLTSWGLNSPPLSPLSSRKLPSKPLLRARQTAGGRERGQMGNWPKTSRPGHRAGPTEVLRRPHGAGQSIDQGSSPKQQAFQGVDLPSDAKGLAWVRTQTHRESLTMPMLGWWLWLQTATLTNHGANPVRCHPRLWWAQSQKCPWAMEHFYQLNSYAGLLKRKSIRKQYLISLHVSADVSVWVSSSCLDKAPQTGVSTTDLRPPTVLEAGSLR